MLVGTCALVRALAVRARWRRAAGCAQAACPAALRCEGVASRAEELEALDGRCFAASSRSPSGGEVLGELFVEVRTSGPTGSDHATARSAWTAAPLPAVRVRAGRRRLRTAAISIAYRAVSSFFANWARLARTPRVPPRARLVHASDQPSSCSRRRAAPVGRCGPLLTELDAARRPRAQALRRRLPRAQAMRGPGVTRKPILPAAVARSNAVTKSGYAAAGSPPENAASGPRSSGTRTSTTACPAPTRSASSRRSPQRSNSSRSPSTRASCVSTSRPALVARPHEVELCSVNCCSVRSRSSKSQREAGADPRVGDPSESVQRGRVAGAGAAGLAALLDNVSSQARRC